MTAKLPTAIKKLTGTYQPARDVPDALDNTGVAPVGHPELIAHDDVAIERYHQLIVHVTQMKVISQEDDFALALLAMRLVEVERSSAVIRIHGTTYQTKTKQGDLMWRARPEVAMRNEAMRHAQSLLNEFGLTPAARSRVSAKSNDDDNPFGVFK